VAQIKWRPRALADIERLHAFLNNKNSAVVRQAAYVIFQAARLLETTPRIGRPMPDDTRRRELFVPFGAGAYVIRYVLEANNTIIVVRVWHSKENLI